MLGAVLRKYGARLILSYGCTARARGAGEGELSVAGLRRSGGNLRGKAGKVDGFQQSGCDQACHPARTCVTLQGRYFERDVVCGLLHRSMTHHSANLLQQQGWSGAEESAAEDDGLRVKQIYEIGCRGPNM